MNAKSVILLTLLGWVGLLAAQPLPPTVAWLRADSLGIPAGLAQKRLLYIETEPGEVFNGGSIDRLVARSLGDYPHPVEIISRADLVSRLAGAPLASRYDYQLRIGTDGQAYYVLLHHLHTGSWYLPDDHAYLSVGGSLKAFLQRVADPVPAQARALPEAWRARCADDRGDRQALAPTLATCPLIDFLGLPPGLATDTLAVVPLPADHAFAKALNPVLRQFPRDYPYLATTLSAEATTTARYQLRVGKMTYFYTVYIPGQLLSGQDASFFYFIEDRETGQRYAPAPMPVMARQMNQVFRRALR